MADVIKQEPIRTVYKDGTIVISNVRDPRTNELVSFTVKDSWYDGSGMNDSKIDPWGIFTKFQPTGEYIRKNLPNWGENFLEVDSIQELRDLDPYFQHLIFVEYYKGVQLNGYRSKGDLQQNIKYLKSSLPPVDNGGNVIVSGNLVLSYVLNPVVDVRTFGIFKDHIDTARLQEVLTILEGKEILFKESSYFIDGTTNSDMGLIVPSNTSILTSDNTWFHIIPNNRGKYGGFTFNGSNNYVNNLKVKGDRTQHLNPIGGTWNEWLPSSSVTVGQYIVKHAIGYKVTQSGTTGLVNDYINSSSVTIGQVFNDGTAKLEVASRVGEWGMGINLIEAKNFKADYLECVDCWGDGLYFGRRNDVYGVFSERVRIGEYRARNNRRQGISFITAKDVKIGYANISKTKGVAPESGIDFESNDYRDVLSGIVIEKLDTSENFLTGVLFDPQKLSNLSYPVDITIKQHNSNGERSFRTMGDHANHVTGTIRYQNLTSYEAPTMAVEIRNYYNGPDILIENPTIVNPNASNRTPDAYASGIMIYKDQTDPAPVEGHYSPYINIIKPKVIDNRSVKRMWSGILCQSFRSNPTFIKNVKIEDPVIEGYITSPIVYNSNLDVADSLDGLKKVISTSAVFDQNTSCFKKYSNSGASGDCVLTLNGTLSKIRVKAIVEISQNLIINFGSGTLIGLNVNQLSSSQIGAELEFECVNPTGNVWKVVSGIGNWVSGSRNFRFGRNTEATSAIAGAVKQSAYMENILVPAITSVSTSSATTLEQLVSDVNAFIGKYNNENVPLTNTTRAKTNDKLNNDKLSGQQLTV